MENLSCLSLAQIYAELAASRVFFLLLCISAWNLYLLFRHEPCSEDSTGGYFGWFLQLVFSSYDAVYLYVVEDNIDGGGSSCSLFICYSLLSSLI